MIQYESCYSAENNQLLIQQQTLIKSILPQVVEGFYQALLNNPETQKFLDEDIVRNRLYHAQKKWLINVLQPHTEADKEAFLAEQFKIGEIHARIELPLSLMEEATWFYKKLFFQALIQQPLRDGSVSSDKLLARSKLFLIIAEIIEFSTSQINNAYQKQETRLTQEKQTLALTYSDGEFAHELILIKSEITEWLLETILQLQEGKPPKSEDFSNTDFYLWITHRLPLIEETHPQCQKIYQLTEKLSNFIQSNQAQACDHFIETIHQLKNQTKELTYALQELSDDLRKENSNRDPLTRLFNRRLLEAALAKEHHLARTKHASYAILMADIDHFKKFNDTYGHEAGDVVLKEVAQRLQAQIRVTDLAFRFGGEEFLVLLPATEEVSPQTLVAIGEKIRRAVKATPINLHNQRLTVTISVGIAQYDHHPDYIHTLQEADAALYQAKKRGRDCVVLYHQDQK
ncbi:diguanylate cyclase [Galenea microaerophila]